MFHGSDTITDLLSPARARNHGKQDSRAKVFATELPVVAVFHALARTVKRSEPSQSGTKHGFSVDDNGDVTLRGEKDLLDQIAKTRQITNIYVLDKALFQKKSDMEWHAKQTIAPVGVVFVKGSDLKSLIGPRVKLKQLV